MHVLYEQLMKYSELISRYEEYFTTGLVLDDDGNCVGAVLRNVADGSMELFEAENVILATGGNGQVWQPTTNALICTGDGIAMAYRAGAPLMDMEMIQYHPTTLAKKGFLITEGARGEGAHLLNAQGERFMETLRAEQDGAGLPRRRLARRADRDQRGARLSRRHRGARHHRRAPQADPRGASRDRARGPRLRRGRHHPRADPHQARQPLHDGRREDRRRRRHLDPGPLRRRRGRLRVGARRQPAGRQLAARHVDLRPPRRASTPPLAPSESSSAGPRRPRSPMPSAGSRSSSAASRARAAGSRSSAGSWARRWTSTSPSSAPERGSRPPWRPSSASRRRPRPPTSTTTAPSSTRTCWARSSWGSCSTAPSARCVAALHRTESRGAQYRTDFPERNDDEWLKHITVTRNSEGPEIGYSPVTITQWQPDRRGPTRVGSACPSTRSR